MPEYRYPGLSGLWEAAEGSEADLQLVEDLQTSGSKVLLEKGPDRRRASHPNEVWARTQDADKSLRSAIWALRSRKVFSKYEDLLRAMNTLAGGR